MTEPDEDLELLRRLGEVQRDDSERTEQWWRAADEGRQDALPPGSPPVETFRPLDDGEREALTQSVFGPLAEEENVVSLAERRRPWLAAAGAIVAVAACALLFLRPADEAVLPAYEARVVTSEQAMRGDPGSERATFTEGSRVEVWVRPEALVTGAVTLTADLLDDADDARPWTGTIEQKDGAFRLVGVFGDDLDLTPGDWTLRLRVHRPGTDEPTDGQEHRLKLRLQPLDE